MTRVAFLAASLLLACCANAFSQAKPDTQKLSGVLTGDDKGPAAKNPQCKLFSTAEAGRYIGAPVVAMENAAMGAGCQWVAKGDNDSMVVAVVPKSNHEPAKSAAGFKKLPDVGVRGFVVPDMGGWVAGTIVGPDAIRVTLAGKGASESSTVDLLKETLKRRSPAAAK
jgi:hypothetical protein